MIARRTGPTAIILFGMLATPSLGAPAPSDTPDYNASRRASVSDVGPPGAYKRKQTSSRVKRHTRPVIRKALVNYRKESESHGYKRVSSLVNFPSFFAGIGVLYVKPESLPYGPFLAFDRQDRLISTIYMVPVQDIENKKSLDVPGGVGRDDHVTLYFNAGHPGVDLPHYHIVIWHVSKKDEARVAK